MVFKKTYISFSVSFFSSQLICLCIPSLKSIRTHTKKVRIIITNISCIYCYVVRENNPEKTEYHDNENTSSSIFAVKNQRLFRRHERFFLIRGEVKTCVKMPFHKTTSCQSHWKSYLQTHTDRGAVSRFEGSGGLS